jgi:transposase
MKNLDQNIDEIQYYMKQRDDVIHMVQKIILGMIKAKTVNLMDVANHFKKGKQPSNYRAIQRFFQHQNLDDDDVIDFIIDLLFDKNEKLKLIIDRTDWQFGKTRHNLLMISVSYENTAIPLMVKPLERKGNSNTAQRIEMMDSILEIIPVHRIEIFLGDREFIGNDWLKYLKSKEIPFIMRVRDNINIGYEEDNKFKCYSIKELMKEKKEYNGDVHIGTENLKLTGKWGNEEKEKPEIALISYGAENVLDSYRRRWDIEVGFKCLKTNGFRIEDTGLKEARRIRTLVQLTGMAMAIFMAAMPEEEKIKVRTLKKSVADAETLYFLNPLELLNIS